MSTFALIDQNHQVVRSTDGFPGLGVDIEELWVDQPELGQVLNGQADRATLTVGEASFSVDAVTDSAGRPHALLSPAAGPDMPPAPDDPVARLRPLLDESPAMAWIKDPAGRHLYANQRCLEALGVSEERLLGRTDTELAPHESVDGPRLSLAQDGIDESLELEYSVPAVGSRGRLAAVRFAIRDAEGNAVAICGLAGPLENAWIVRDEASRVARNEPRSLEGSSAVRAELLDEWGLALGSPGSGDHGSDPGQPSGDVDTPGPEPAERASEPAEGASRPGEQISEPAEGASPATAPAPVGPELAGPTLAPAPESDMTRRWDEVVQRLQEEARSWQQEVAQVRSVVERAEQQARQALDERDAAYMEGEQARRERDELARTLEVERERGDELTRVIAQLRSQIADLGRTLDQTLPVSSQSPSDNADQGQTDQALANMWAGAQAS